MCYVPSIAVFCSESIERFPGTASKFFLKLLVTIPVAPIITGIIAHFRFHMRYISIHKLLYFNFSLLLLLLLLLLLPIPVAARSKAWVWFCSLAGITGSNPAGHGCLSVWVSACCVLSETGLCVGLITRPEETYRVWCVWVWSLSLDHGHSPLWAVAPWNLLLLLLLLLLISALQPFLL